MSCELKKRQGGMVCSYKNCKSKSYLTNGVRYFTFPIDKQRGDLWIIAAGREDLLLKEYKQIYRSHRICSLHFDNDMYVGPARTKLLPLAMPIDANYNVSCQPSDLGIEQETNMDARDDLISPKIEVEELIIKDEFVENDRDAGQEHSLSVTPNYNTDSSAIINEIKIEPSMNDTELKEVKENEAEGTSDKKIFNCNICQQCFLQSVPYERHMLRHRNARHKCPECGKVAHLKMHGNKVFRFNSSLGMQKANHTTGEKPFQCDTCQKRFSQRAVLNRHILVHTGEKPFQCDTCGRRFSRLALLKNHKLLLHSDDEHINLTNTNNPKLFQCDTCKKCFSQEVSLEMHMTCHATNLLFECDACHKFYLNRASFRRHKVSHKGQELFQCDTCQKQFLSKANLQFHMSIHTGKKPFYCDTCQKGFASKHTLHLHTMVHSCQKPFKCDSCQKLFSQKGYLKQHMFADSSQKPFECDKCRKCFTCRLEFSRHWAVHTPEKPFKCPKCEKSFSRNVNLKMHLTVHTDEKPFCCNTCHKCFRKSSNLKSHMLVHTNITLFQCDTCQQCFEIKSKLDEHLLSHVELKPVKCEVSDS